MNPEPEYPRLRRMGEVGYREEQLAQRYHCTVAPINRLVDRLRQEDWAPYIAPIYGGINARLLSILRDPGPATRSGEGSGLLSMENDDRTAENVCKLFADARIPAHDIVPWNIYPWYINRAPSPRELDKGVAALLQLIDLLPRLRVIMLHGRSAQAGWRRLSRRYPNIQLQSVDVIETYHPSPQAFWHPSAAIRDQRRDHLQAAFERAAAVLRLDDGKRENDA